MSTEVAIALMIVCHTGISVVIYIALQGLEARLEKLMEGQILLMDFAAEGGKFLSQIQTVQVMARRDFDEETMQ